MIAPLAGAGLYLRGKVSADGSSVGMPATEGAAVYADPSSAYMLEVRYDGRWAQVGEDALRLPPGHYEVRWRIVGVRQWERASLSVDAGVAYTLAIRDGALDAKAGRMEGSR